MKYQYRGLFVGAIALMLIGAGCVSPSTNPNDNQNDTPNSGDQDTQEQMQITVPQEGATVSSPLQVSGQVPGSWATEGQLMIEIRDSEGSVVTSTVTSVDNWMTTDLQSFEATLSYTLTAEQSGSIAVVKGNPSGLPEQADEITQSVTLSASRPTAKGTFSNWMRTDISSLGISIMTPEEVKRGSSDQNVSFYYQGPTQREGTEWYDGLSMSFFSESLGKDQTLRSFVRAKYEEDKTSPVGIGLTELQEKNIAGKNGYTYTYESIGDIEKYFVLNGADVLVIHILDPDPENRGYSEVGEAIIQSINF